MFVITDKIEELIDQFLRNDKDATKHYENKKYGVDTMVKVKESNAANFKSVLRKLNEKDDEYRTRDSFKELLSHQISCEFNKFIEEKGVIPKQLNVSHMMFKSLYGHEFKYYTYTFQGMTVNVMDGVYGWYIE